MEVRNYPGLPQPSQQPGGRQRVRPCRGTRRFLLGQLGSRTQNKELWQPPGVPLQLHSFGLLSWPGWMEMEGAGVGGWRSPGPAVPVCLQGH